MAENETPAAESALSGKKANKTSAPVAQEETFQVTASALKDFALIIAEAMKDARKPYVSEEQKQNEDQMRKQMKRQAEQAKQALISSQASCPHIQGCNPLSEAMSPTNATSIVWHKLDTNVVVGLCTNCLRPFWPTDSDYAQWRGKKSGNRTSASGYREFMDPAAAAAVR